MNLVNISMSESNEDFVSAILAEDQSNLSDTSRYRSMESLNNNLVTEKGNIVDVFNPDSFCPYEMVPTEPGIKKSAEMFLKPEEYRIYLQFKNTPHLSSWPFLKGFIDLYREYCQLLDQPNACSESEPIDPFEDIHHENQNNDDIFRRKSRYNQNKKVIQYWKDKLRQIKFLGQTDNEAVFFDRIESDAKPKIDVYTKRKPQAVINHKIKLAAQTNKSTNKDKLKWTRLPIALELLLPNVQKQIQRILNTCDFICDPLEVVAELRSFNYDTESTIAHFRATKDIRSVLHDSKMNKIYNHQYKKLFQLSSTNLKDLISTSHGLNNQNTDCQRKEGPENAKWDDTQVEEASMTETKVTCFSQGDLQKVGDITAVIKILKSDLETIRSGRNQLKKELENLNCDFISIKQDLQYYISKLMNAREIKKDATAGGPLKEKITILARQVEELKVKLKEEEKRRRCVYNAMQEQVGNIRVYCRCRNVENKPGFVLVRGNSVRLKSVNSDEFTFERIFSSNTNQSQIFDEFIQLIESYIDGYNVSFITYGSEASGKTYTLIGQPNGRQADFGLMQRALGAVLSEGRKKARDWDYNLSAAIVEIYNEDFRDFVGGTQHLQLYIDQGLEAIFKSLQTVEISDESDVNELVAMCYEKRVSARTALNPASSRSHLICIFRLQGRSRIHGEQFVSFLSLCDLAGFEDIIKAETHRSKTLTSEAGYINKSLTAFNRLFASLKKQDPASACYRDTKLTHILKPFLTNSGKCALIMTIRTDKDSLPSTVSTLKFGKEARGVNLGKAMRQVDLSKFEIL